MSSKLWQMEIESDDETSSSSAGSPRIDPSLADRYMNTSTTASQVEAAKQQSDDDAEYGERRARRHRSHGEIMNLVASATFVILVVENMDYLPRCRTLLKALSLPESIKPVWLIVTSAVRQVNVHDIIPKEYVDMFKMLILYATSLEETEPNEPSYHDRGNGFASNVLTHRNVMWLSERFFNAVLLAHIMTTNHNMHYRYLLTADRFMQVGFSDKNDPSDEVDLCSATFQDSNRLRIPTDRMVAMAKIAVHQGKILELMRDCDTQTCANVQIVSSLGVMPRSNIVSPIMQTLLCDTDSVTEGEIMDEPPMQSEEPTVQDQHKSMANFTRLTSWFTSLGSNPSVLTTMLVAAVLVTLTALPMTRFLVMFPWTLFTYAFRSASLPLWGLGKTVYSTPTWAVAFGTLATCAWVVSAAYALQKLAMSLFDRTTPATTSG